MPLHSCTPTVPVLKPLSIISQRCGSFPRPCRSEEESEVLWKDVTEIKRGLLREACMEFRHRAQCGEKTSQTLQQLNQRSRDREVHLQVGSEQYLKRQQVKL